MSEQNPAEYSPTLQELRYMRQVLDEMRTHTQQIRRAANLYFVLTIIGILFGLCSGLLWFATMMELFSY